MSKQEKQETLIGPFYIPASVILELMAEGKIRFVADEVEQPKKKRKYVRKQKENVGSSYPASLPQKRKLGRPKGSKNHVPEEVAFEKAVPDSAPKKKTRKSKEEADWSDLFSSNNLHHKKISKTNRKNKK
jgi:hypothetical protein